MPRHPHNATSLERTSGGFVFSPLAKKLADRSRTAFHLHVGDTWMDPFEGGRSQDLRVDEVERLHCYSHPRGRKDVIEVVVEKVRASNRIPCEPDSVLMTAGATGALSAAAGAILDPDDDVLVCAPFWPLITGVIRNAGGHPVEVSFYDHVRNAGEAAGVLRAAKTPRTVALYISTPSNPTGRVVPSDQLEAVAEWAREENLWILSDEVYENYVYRGEHVSIARFAPERTLTAFSFSKSYGMAGNRAGYLVGPPDTVRNALKVSTNTVYAAPTAGQVAGARALRNGEAWLAEARRAYREIGDEVAGTLGVGPPEGSTFLFLDAAPRLDERGILGFLEDCLDDDVVVTPGAACGEAYATWIRVCFTSMAPDAVREGARRLALRLGRDSR